MTTSIIIGDCNFLDPFLFNSALKSIQANWPIISCSSSRLPGIEMGSCLNHKAAQLLNDFTSQNP